MCMEGGVYCVVFLYLFGDVYPLHLNSCISINATMTFDLMCLPHRLQKHHAFEAELSANKGRVDSVDQTGEGLIDGNHYAAHEIEARIDSLRTHWVNLSEK